MVIWSQILLCGNPPAKLENTICDHKLDDLCPIMTNFNCYFHSNAESAFMTFTFLLIQKTQGVGHRTYNPRTVSLALLNRI